MTFLRSRLLRVSRRKAKESSPFFSKRTVPCLASGLFLVVLLRVFDFSSEDHLWQPEPSQQELDRSHFAPCDSALQEDNSGILRNVQGQVANVKLPFSDGSFAMTIHTRDDDTAVSASIVRKGCFDCELWNKTLGALHEYRREDPILLDIGANIGIFGLTAAAMGVDVYAFEPFRKNWIRICQTLQSNPQIDEKFQLFQKALSSSGPQKITYKMRGHYKNPSNLQIQLGSHTFQVEEGTEGVEYGWAIALDSISHHFPTNRPVVIKLDVEEHECEVFAGAMRYLNQVRLVHVLIELRSEQIKRCSNIKDIFALMDKNNLKPWLLLGGKSIPLDHSNLTPWTETETKGEFNVEWKPEG